MMLAIVRFNRLYASSHAINTAEKNAFYTINFVLLSAALSRKVIAALRLRTAILATKSHLTCQASSKNEKKKKTVHTNYAACAKTKEIIKKKKISWKIYDKLDFKNWNQLKGFILRCSCNKEISFIEIRIEFRWISLIQQYNWHRTVVYKRNTRSEKNVPVTIFNMVFNIFTFSHGSSSVHYKNATERLWAISLNFFPLAVVIPFFVQNQAPMVATLTSTSFSSFKLERNTIYSFR